MWTEDSVAQHFALELGKENVRRQNEIARISPAIKTALVKSASMGYGNRPEALILDPITKQPRVLVEVKGSAQDLETAVIEVSGYGLGMFAGGVRVPLLLAARLREAELLYLTADGTIQPCLDQMGQPIKFLPSAEEIENLVANEGRIRIADKQELTEEQLAEFCKDINETFHSSNIVEGDRAKLFTAFLIALLDDTFKHNYLQDAGRAAVEAAAGRSGTPSDKEARLWAKVKSDVNGAIENIRNTRSLTISEKIRLIDPKDSKAIWAVTSHIMSKSKSSDYVTHLLNSTYLLGDVYETFYTYTGKNSMGQYFTPRHVVEFMVRITEQIRSKPIDYETDVVYDPACGVGGFLVSSFKRAIFNARLGEQSRAREHFGAHGVFGVDNASEIASIARVNMLLRGDGKSGIIEGDSLKPNFVTNEFARRLVKPTIGLMNPPFPAKREDPRAHLFVEHAIDVSAIGAFIVALVPTSTVLASGKKENVANEKTFRKKALKTCQLKCVITLPQDLFYPKAAANTSIVILEKTGKAHDANQKVIFGRCPSDGYRPNKSTGARSLDRSPSALNALGTFEKVWLRDYLDGKPGSASVPLHFIATEFSAAAASSGSEWTPESLIEGLTKFDEVQKAFLPIYGQRLSVDISADICAGKMNFLGYESRKYTITPKRLELLKRALVAEYGPAPTIEHVFTHRNGNFKGDLEGLAAYGSHAVVSATEFNNGIVGYTDDDLGGLTFGISLAKNGKPGVCRVQGAVPCILTGDVLFLSPKMPRRRGHRMNERTLVLLAAVLQQKIWRFNYGRKATWDRIRQLKIFE